MELSALYAINPIPPGKIAFIGSGPLPLSSLCLSHALSNGHAAHKQTQTQLITVLNIDNNPQAISQSSALVKSLGTKAKGMQFLCREAGTSPLNLKAFDIVYLAALVGMTQEEKERVLIHVVRGMRVSTLLVIRTAHGLRSLLYPVCFTFWKG